MFGYPTYISYIVYMLLYSKHVVVLSMQDIVYWFLSMKSYPFRTLLAHWYLLVNMLKSHQYRSQVNNYTCTNVIGLHAHIQ